jgi:hypothetical protein
MRGQTPYLRGRLRLRFSQLRNDPLRLARVCDALRGIDGVQAIEASQLNGGMLIHYNARLARRPGFWDEVEAVLESNELYHTPTPYQERAADQPSSGRGVVNTVAETLVQKLIERSATALVAALL